MKNTFIPVVMVFVSCNVIAQVNDTDSTKHFSTGIYMDVYYQVEPENPGSKERPFFLYNFKRNNEFNINLALVKFDYKKDKVQVKFGLMTGTYAQHNLSAEQTLFRHIFEANINYDISKKTSLTVGIMPSHIGAESAVSKDNWNLSRSLLAENSPYYETGIKLTHTISPKWQYAVLLLNGWQNMHDNNSAKAIGAQLQYKPSDNILFNYSTFIGNEKPDSVKRQVRFFNNFYATINITNRLKTNLLADIGFEEKASAANELNNWFGTAILLQYKIKEKLTAAARAEYFQDNENVIIAATPGANGFKIFGASLNADYNITENLNWRIESRMFFTPENIFFRNNSLKSYNYSFLTAFAFSL